MDIFGLKARKENEYLAKCLMKDKEALYKAKNLIQLQEHKIYKLEQEIDYLKMINNMKVDYPNSKKS
jgi:hypothetical protein